MRNKGGRGGEKKKKKRGGKKNGVLLFLPVLPRELEKKERRGGVFRLQEGKRGGKGERAGEGGRKGKEKRRIDRPLVSIIFLARRERKEKGKAREPKGKKGTERSAEVLFTFSADRYERRGGGKGEERIRGRKRKVGRTSPSLPISREIGEGGGKMEVRADPKRGKRKGEEEKL